MLLIKGFLILIWLFFIPLCVGTLPYAGRKHVMEFNLRKIWLWGYLILFALYEVLAIPMTFLSLPFHVLCFAFGGLSVILAIGGFLCMRKYKVKALPGRQKKGLTIYGWIAILLMMLQIMAAVLGWHSDADDSFFVATANTTVTTDTIFQFDAYTGEHYMAFPARYVLAPFQIWVAFLSKAVHMHPATVAHTVLPVALIPLAYTVYSLIGETLMGNSRKKNDLFLMFVAIILMSSYYSVYTQGTFLLVRIWQGKAVLAAILLPAVFWLCLCLMVEKQERLWLLLACAMIACLMVSSMGLLLPVLIVGILSLRYGIFEKNWSILLRSVMVCIPNLLFAIMYLILKS